MIAVGDIFLLLKKFNIFVQGSFMGTNNHCGFKKFNESDLGCPHMDWFFGERLIKGIVEFTERVYNELLTAVENHCFFQMEQSLKK